MIYRARLASRYDSGQGSRVERRYGPLMMLMILIMVLLGLAQSNTGEAAANTEVADANSLFLPATMNGYFEGAVNNPGGISGYITVKEEAIANIVIDLYFNDGQDWSKVKTTTTNEAGLYRFEDVDALLPGESYYVSYGPNNSDPNLVANWYGPIIDEYRNGDRIWGGDFDLADVPLVDPASGFEGELPINFVWERRGISGESYRMVVIDLENNIFWPTFDLGDEDSFELNVLAPDMLFNTPYAWYVEVYLGPENFGESFMLNDIEFRPPSASVGFMREGAAYDVLETDARRDERSRVVTTHTGQP